MKKLFSYLLISSMVVLSSCTNYDDQFDDLNTQINTLKSQIEGFSSLSSGLTALQGTVASLQTAIANIPVTPATDISGLESTQATLTAALTALAADVKALQDTLATAATAAEVAALQTALAAAQSDLTDLLAANNVYSQDLIIDSASTLAFAESLGDKVGIINGSVVMYVTTTMDVTKVQAVANKMKTITGNLSYFSAANTIAAVSFDALTGAGDIEIAQAGSISFPVLASAKDITLGNNYESKFDGTVDLGALQTVTSIGTEAITYHSSGGTAADKVKVPATKANANSIKFNKATGVDLASLVRYDDNFEVAVKSGTLDLSSLTNANAIAGAADTTKSLTASGVTVLTAPLRTGGAIVASDVLEVSLPLWTGVTGSSFAKATSVVLPKITGGLTIAINTWAPKATKFHVIGAAKALTTTTTATPSVTSTGQNNLVTLILDGVLETVTIDGATDLTSITHTGTAKNVTYKGTGATTMDLGFTAGKTGTTNALAKNGGLTIENNLSLTSFTADKLDDIVSLTIKGNTDLETISMAALNSTGTATAASVEISGNDLTVDSIQLASATGALPVVAKTIKSADFGPLKAYIEAAKLKVGTTGSIIVVADTVTEKLNANGTAATVVAGDKTIANFLNAAARTSNMVGGTAQVKEFALVDNDQTTNTYSISVNGFVSEIPNTASDLSYDLAAWAATSSVVAGLDAAGVTVTTGSGPKFGRTKLTNISATALTHTFAVSVNSKTYSVTLSGPLQDTTADVKKVIDGLALQIAGNVDVTNAKFTVSSATAGQLNFATVARGSASAAFPLGKITSYVGTSTAGTPTVITSTVDAVTGNTKAGYIRVTNKTAGLVAAANVNAVILGGAVSATTLVSDGTVASPAHGDNENVVAAKDGTGQTNQAAIAAASVYEADHLVS